MILELTVYIVFIGYAVIFDNALDFDAKNKDNVEVVESEE